MVQGNDTALAWRRTGFDSRWVHSTPLRGSDGVAKRKVAGYGWPGLGANECAPEGVRVRIPCLPLEDEGPDLPRW
jgi:hypothetical protein